MSLRNCAVSLIARSAPAGIALNISPDVKASPISLATEANLPVKLLSFSKSSSSVSVLDSFKRKLVEIRDVLVRKTKFTRYFLDHYCVSF